jgi:hypothetical protein
MPFMIKLSHVNNENVAESYLRRESLGLNIIERRIFTLTSQQFFMSTCFDNSTFFQTSNVDLRQSRQKLKIKIKLTLYYPHV